LAIDDWKPRPRGRRPPYGFIPQSDIQEGGDPNLLVPDPVIIPLLDETLDQLDAGISLREAADWLNAQEGIKSKLSHSGLRLIWDTQRPDHPVKILREKDKKPKLTRSERAIQKKKKEIASQKKSLAHLKRRIERQEGVISQKKVEIKEKEREALTPPPPYVELEAVEWDLSVVPEDREIIFTPNPGPQTEFFASDELEVLYGGAAGGGKSYALIADPMRYFSHPEFNGLIVRRTNDELRELIWKSQLLYPKAYPKSTWSEKKSSWTFPAGGHLWMTYLEREEDVMRYHGQAFSYIGFDELTQHPTPYAWNFMRSRLRTTAKDLPLYMRATTNPGGPGHGWVKRMFIDPAPPGVPFPATDIDTGETLVYPDTRLVNGETVPHPLAGKPLFYRKFIQAKLSDNPYLYEDGKYEANLMSQSDNQRRQLLEGDWTVADGAAFPEFRMSLHVCKPFELPENWMRFRSCDFGYSQRQASAVHWYCVDPTFGTLYVYRELYVNGHTGTELGKKILAIEERANERISYGVLDSSVWAVRGQSGPTIAEEILKTGCRMRPSDRSAGSRIASKNRLHELLRVDPESGKPGIIFFDNCRQIIADLPIIPSAPATQGDDDIDRRFASDHAYDSIRYGIQTRPRNLATWDWMSQKPVEAYRPADAVFGY